GWRVGVDLADANDLPDQVPSQNESQGRADIDRQKSDAVRGGAADAAVEGPRRAIDGDRQGVDVRISDDALSAIRPLVAVIGDGEQETQVQKRDDDDCRRGE